MIWHLMGAIAALGSLLAATRVRSPDRPVLFGVAMVLCAVVPVYAVIESVLAQVCPACSRRAMWRLARHRHYYRCRACRARFKRFGFGPWLDASGPEDEDRYRKPTDAGIWRGFSVPKDLKGSNSGALLASKRFRDPLDVVKQYPPRRDSGRRLEQAEKKVREFLKRRRDDQGEPTA
jgi:hypothetical protein